MRKLILVFFSLVCFSASNAYSSTSQVLSLAVSFDYTLNVNEPQVFANYLFWEVNVICHIKGKETESPILVKSIYKSGSVNGRHINDGESLMLMIKNADKLAITAASRAKFELINQGDQPVMLQCQLA